MSQFQKCPNGHYYQGTSCPYCPSEKELGGTIYYPKDNERSGNIFDHYKPQSGERVLAGDVEPRPIRPHKPIGEGQTVGIFIPEPIPNPRPGTEIIGGGFSRKLVGFLISYTLDEKGTFFPLYEGKNTIGSSIDCSITVNGVGMSGKHATLLFVPSTVSYKLQDEFTVNGTFVNDEDIDLGPRKLNDSDIIRMGETTFKFRTSL
jgi:hypothetical protein